MENKSAFLDKTSYRQAYLFEKYAYFNLQEATHFRKIGSNN